MGKNIKQTIRLNESQLKKIVTENVKKVLKEISYNKMVLQYYSPGNGNTVMPIDSLEDAKPYIKNASYWHITRGYNSSEPENLVAWGGKGGYWDNFININNPVNKNNWRQPSESIIKLILSKKVNESANNVLKENPEWQNGVNPKALAQWKKEDAEELEQKYDALTNALWALQNIINQRYPELSEKIEKMYAILYDEIGDTLQLNK